MFTKEERGTFKYHFSHWCAFQMTALNFKVWQPHMLLHDWYKPWMKLFCDYKTVQRFHRTHSKHHLEYFLDKPENIVKVRWLDMVIDWECSRFTKADAQMNAYETYLYEIDKLKKSEKYLYAVTFLKINIFPILNKLGIAK